MNFLLALLPAWFVASAAFAAPGLKAGGLTEFQVELPRESRQVAGRGQLSPVAHALVVIAAPANFDPARDWPVMIINATSDPQYNSSRFLLLAYKDTALAAGWILVAADPVEEVTVEQDGVPLRYALSKVALAALNLQWPGAAKAPLAFGGFSGGAKYAGWLAAAFANDGRNVIGLYLAGINENTVVPAARQYRILNDAYRRIPVFLQAGEKDDVSTRTDHQNVYDALQSAGFKNIRLEFFPGTHEVEPKLLRTALDWFRDLAAEQRAPR